MKMKHRAILLLIAAATASLFGCGKNDLTIFEQIEQETKLEDAVITGSVNSVVQFNGRLYASDGNLYAKDVAAVRGWSEPGGRPGGIIIKLAAASTHLYALNGDKILYASTDGSTWSQVDTAAAGAIQTIFCNGLDTAYLKTTAGAFHKLSGSSAPVSDATVTSDVLLKHNSVTYTANNGAVTDTLGGAVGDLGTVYSLTYSAVDSSIYAGTSKGLRRLPVDATGKLAGNMDPPGNWSATIKTYEAFAVMATGTSAADSALYSSTIASGSDYVKVNGLWGYYYDRRNSWNRE